MTQPTTLTPPTTVTDTPPPPVWPAAWGMTPPPPPAKRKTGRCILGAIGLFILIATIAGASEKDTTSTAGGVVTPTTSVSPSTAATGTSAGTSVSAWAARYGSADADTLSADLTAIASDAGAMDVSGMSSSCRTFQRHLTAAGSHLPTPDAQLTSALRQAYGYFGRATTACLLGIATLDPDTLGEMTTYLELGSASIATATARIGALS